VWVTIHVNTIHVAMRTSLRFASRAPRALPWFLTHRSAALHTRSAPDSRTTNNLIINSTRARQLLDLHGEYGRSFDHINLSTCWSKLGKVIPADRTLLQSNDGACLSALREQTIGQLSTFDPRHVSGTAHALAKLDLQGAKWKRLWKELEGAALARKSELKPQGLANTAWAFATAGHAAPALFDAIGTQSAERVQAFKPQELSNTAWAFAKAGHAAPALFDAIETESAGRLQEFTAQNLSNMAWAFATAGHAAPQLFEAIGAASTARVHELAPQHLANMAWAFAKAGYAAPALLDAIGKASAGRVREFKPQALASTAWAFSKAGHAAPALFDAIGKESAKRVRDFKPQALSGMLMAFATVGHPAPALFDAIGKEAAGRIHDFSPQALANTAWACAVSDHMPTSLFGQRFARHCDALTDEFRTENLYQLHQWRLWYERERACSSGLPGAALLARCDAAFRSVETQPTRMQREVAQVAASLSSVQQEVLLKEGYRLHLVVDWRGERLTIEVDGPSRFVGHKPTGATLLKRRQLKHFGRRLVSVAYWEWYELSHADKFMEREQRVAYLMKALTDATALPNR